MVIIPPVFSGNQCMNKVWRQFIITYKNPVFVTLRISKQELVVRRNYLRGIFIDRIFQFIDTRQVSNQSG